MSRRHPRSGTWRRIIAAAAITVLAAACSDDAASPPSNPSIPVDEATPGSGDPGTGDAGGGDGAGTGASASTDDAGLDPEVDTEQLPVLDDVVAEPWEPTTRTDELALQLAAAEGTIPLQVAVDVFDLVYGDMPGATPSDLPDGEGFGTTYALGLIESVRDRLAPEQLTILDAIDQGIEEEGTIGGPDAVEGTHGGGLLHPAGIAGPVVRGPVFNKYQPLLEQAIADWAAYRPSLALPATIGLQIMTFDVKGADMDAYPLEPGLCRIRVFPQLRSSAPSDVDITTAFAHELFHCAQFLMGDWGAAPNWVIEGGASFASFDLYRSVHAPPKRYAFDTWFKAGNAPLEVRQYGAWPLFEIFRQYGGDPYAAIAVIIASPSRDTGTALGTGGMDGQWFRTEWGSRTVRSTRYAGPPWAMAWPSPGGAGGPTDNLAQAGSRGVGSYTITSTGEYSQYEMSVDVSSEVGILAVVPVHGPMTTYAATGTIVIAAQELVKFCFSPDGCMCPEGTVSDTIPMNDRKMVYSFAAGNETPSAAVKAVKWDPDKHCKKKPRERGTHNGDPHLVTFDGVAYDVMAMGEFVMARDSDGGFEVQARHEPIGIGGAGTSAVALTDGTHRVTFTAPALESDATLTVRVDGDEVDAAAPVGPPGLEITTVADSHQWTVTWDDGSTVDLLWNLGWFVTVSPSDERAPRLVGLLGGANDDPRDDLTLPDGTIVDPGGDQDLLDETFARAWLVDDDSTLFDYAAGQSPASFAAVELRGAPSAPSDDVIARCEQALGEAASTHEVDSCAYDVTVTGDDTFVDTYTEVVVDRVVDEDEPLAPGADAGAPPAGNGTDPSAPRTGEAALELSGLLGSGFGSEVDDAQVTELIGSLELRSGAVVIGVASLCAGDVDLVLEVTRRDDGGGAQTRLCDPIGFKTPFADEDDEIVAGEGYVLIGADGVYDVRVTSDADDPIFTEVAIYADSDPEVLDVDDASASGWSGTLAGTGDAVVLPITTGEASATYDITAPDDVCVMDVYGPDPPGDTDPWAIDVCQHGANLSFSPTFELVIPVVVFNRTGAPVDVTISPSSE